MTDPTLKFVYKYALQKLVVTLNWKYVLKAFAFEWGFFWKHWTWKGWSKKKIIKKWPISNGINKTYQILNW